MKRDARAVLRPNEIVVSAAQAKAMGLCTVTGDHEACSPVGCLCGCHRLNPWPWESAEEA